MELSKRQQALRKIYHLNDCGVEDIDLDKAKQLSDDKLEDLISAYYYWDDKHKLFVQYDSSVADK